MPDMKENFIYLSNETICIKLNKTAITVMIFKGIWMILHYGINHFNNSTAILGPQTAAAETNYGIKGRQAPE